MFSMFKMLFSMLTSIFVSGDIASIKLVGASVGLFNDTADYKRVKALRDEHIKGLEEPKATSATE